MDDPSPPRGSLCHTCDYCAHDAPAVSCLDEIVDTSYDLHAKTVRITTASGAAMTFKNVAADDVVTAREFVEHGRLRPLAAPLAFELEQRVEQATLPSTPDEELERFGRNLAHDVFALRVIRIYEKGYVRVSLPMMGSKAKFEKLVAIEASSDVSKKSGVGRGVAAVATVGVNLLGSNKRGDVYLTITTDETTHVLHEDPPTAMNLRTAKRLESVGNSVIHRSAVDPVPTAIQERSTADRLRELQQLRDEGLISEDEHRSQRTRLLGGL